MADIRSPLTCTPEDLLPHIQCLICGRSRQELLAAMDAFLCEALLRNDCTVSSLLPYGAPYMSLSERELVAAYAYLWFVFLQTESPETITNEQSINIAVSPFNGRSNIEILAMQLWLLCQYGDATCDADTLINRGRCYCVGLKDLLAIRVWLMGQFVGNFVEVDMSPDALKAHAIALLGPYSIGLLEAAVAWAICQLYNVAVENQQPT